jgi:preprotein translocase subunit YajC
VGTVKSVGAGTFALTTQDGTTVTVNVGSSTTYLDHDVTSPSIANVTVGAHVAVFGADTSDTVTATKVAIGAPHTGGPGGPGGHDGTPPAAVGTVKSVGAGTFALTTQHGTTVTVNVGSSTTYLDHDVTSPSIANVTVGAHVAVFGTDTSDTVTATKVAIGAPPTGGPRGPRGPGGPGDGGAPPAQG